MIQEKICQECGQKQDCQEVYEQLGRAAGPSVVKKVVVAFLLPLVVFIGLLAGFERILAGVIDGKGLRTGVSFLLAVLGTLALVLVIKVIEKKAGKNRRF